MIFVDVPKHWHFVCSQGGGRNVKVMLDLFGLREARRDFGENHGGGLASNVVKRRHSCPDQSRSNEPS